ncbi:MAG TPA: response regulator transcription factor [Armatimonadota bacterium]|nr:response regulator transcription factor [Armatimonadota bacterium]
MGELTILLVEDESRVAGFLQRGLEEAGYHVELASNGGEGLRKALKGGHDLMILDMMLPGMDGLELIRRARARGITAPVLALTARAGVTDRIEGLDAGCDDYLAKPFAFSELLARLRALSRRSVDVPPGALQSGDLVLDVRNRRASVAGRPVDLTNKEFALLELLLEKNGEPLTRQIIADRIWGGQPDSFSNVVDVYINYLRKKLEEPGGARYIHTVRGVGYVLREEKPMAGK